MKNIIPKIQLFFTNICSKSRILLPFAEIITLKLCCKREFIIGIHLVACPNPQFRGATKILFFEFISRKYIKQSIFVKNKIWEKINYASFQKWKNYQM